MWHLYTVFHKFHTEGSEQCYFHHECGNYFSVLLGHEYQRTFSMDLLFAVLNMQNICIPSKTTNRYIKTTIPFWILKASTHRNLDYSMSVQVHRETSCFRHLHPLQEYCPTDNNVSTHCPLSSVLKLEANTTENLKQSCSVSLKCCLLVYRWAMPCHLQMLSG
jgi:hypothetical protein